MWIWVGAVVEAGVSCFALLLAHLFVEWRLTLASMRPARVQRKPLRAVGATQVGSMGSEC